MTAANFDATRQFVLREEGGYSSDRNDSGNWSSGVTSHGWFVGSNMGVGAPALIAWNNEHHLVPRVTADYMRSLPGSVQAAIFRANYWNVVRADDLPPGCDLMIVDFGWNRGIGTSARLLQQLVGATPDGAVGPATLAAISAVTTETLLARPLLLDVQTLQQALGVAVDGDLGPQTRAAFASLAPSDALLVALAAAQVRSYKWLSNFGTYGRGWLARTALRLSTARALLPTRVAA